MVENAADEIRDEMTRSPLFPERPVCEAKPAVFCSPFGDLFGVHGLRNRCTAAKKAVSDNTDWSGCVTQRLKLPASVSALHPLDNVDLVEFTGHYKFHMTHRKVKHDWKIRHERRDGIKEAEEVVQPAAKIMWYLFTNLGRYAAPLTQFSFVKEKQLITHSNTTPSRPTSHTPTQKLPAHHEEISGSSGTRGSLPRQAKDKAESSKLSETVDNAFVDPDDILSGAAGVYIQPDSEYRSGQETWMVLEFKGSDTFGMVTDKEYNLKEVFACQSEANKFGTRLWVKQVEKALSEFEGGAYMNREVYGSFTQILNYMIARGAHLGLLHCMDVCVFVVLRRRRSLHGGQETGGPLRLVVSYHVMSTDQYSPTVQQVIAYLLRSVDEANGSEENTYEMGGHMNSNQATDAEEVVDRLPWWSISRKKELLRQWLQSQKFTTSVPTKLAEIDVAEQLKEAFAFAVDDFGFIVGSGLFCSVWEYGADVLKIASSDNPEAVRHLSTELQVYRAVANTNLEHIPRLISQGCRGKAYVLHLSKVDLKQPQEESVQRWRTKVRAAFESLRAHCIVHGDVHERNVFVPAGDKPAIVFDFGRGKANASDDELAAEEEVVNKWIDSVLASRS